MDGRRVPEAPVGVLICAEAHGEVRLGGNDVASGEEGRAFKAAISSGGADGMAFKSTRIESSRVA